MEALSCKICRVPYDEEEHSPKNPLCGHDICSSCIKAIINKGIFECPICREKNKAIDSDDFRINFGLLHVVRAFKSQNISLPKEKESTPSGATNGDACKIHKKLIEHRCLKCIRWLCGECLQSHTALTGCTTINSAEAVKCLKEKHIEKTEKSLTFFGDGTKYLTSMIQEHKEKRKELLDKVEIHSQEINKIQSMLDQGNNHQENVVKSKDLLHAVDTPYAVMDKIEVLEEMNQSLQSWSIKSLGAVFSLGLMKKVLKDHKGVNVVIDSKGKKMYSKLSQHDEGIALHRFQEQKDEAGMICRHFASLEKILPQADKMFIELSLGGVGKGKIVIKLEKELPNNIRENMIEIVTGQHGKSLDGVNFNYYYNNTIGNTSMPFSDIKTTPVTCPSISFERGDVIVYYWRGYLQQLLFLVNSYNWAYIKLGIIISGMDVLQECYDYHKQGVSITDCGLILEQE